MKVRDVVWLIQADGCHEIRWRASHRQYRHPSKYEPATVPGHHGDAPAAGTLNSILKQAELK